MESIIKPASKKKKTRLFETYISKVLKQIDPRNGITSNSKQQLNSAICIIAKKIADMALKLTIISKKKTISSKEISNVVKLLLVDELQTNAEKEGQKAIKNFSCQNNIGGGRQMKSGILFPPSICEKFLRQFGLSKLMVTNNAPVFMASVLEYITAEILDLAHVNTTKNKRVRITIRDLQISIDNDVELQTLFKNLHISFLGGGVKQFIHASILQRNLHQHKQIIPADKNKKSHRFRSDTIAIREIKRYQKLSNCVAFGKSSFERSIRKIVNIYKCQIKISKDIFTILQYFIEQYIISILQDANKIAIHNGRVKLISKDLQLICDLRGIQLNDKNSIIKSDEFILSSI
jgi:histone H3/H4